MSGIDDSPLCVRCGTRLSPALDGCLTCGQPGAWSADTSGEWALVLGPVTSQRFRDQAVDQLRRLDPHLNATSAARRLANGPIRVASNLTRESAEALAEAFGTKETLAKAVPANERPTSTGGSNTLVTAGAVAAMVVLGSMALTLMALLGLVGVVIGAVLLLVLLAAMAVFFGRMILKKNAAVPEHDLMVLPVSPAVPQRAAGLVSRLHAGAATRGSDEDRVKEAGLSALRLLARLADPDDFAARIAGGADSELGEVAADAAREAVALAEASDGELSSQERARLTRLESVVGRAVARLDAPADVPAQEIDMELAESLEEQIEAAHAQSAR